MISRLISHLQLDTSVALTVLPVFFLFFVIVLYSMVRGKKSHFDQLSKLPFENSEEKVNG